MPALYDVVTAHYDHRSPCYHGADQKTRSSGLECSPEAFTGSVDSSGNPPAKQDASHTV